MGILEEKECLNRARASCLENIRTLNVWGSDLYDISIIRKMINIEVLNLSANNVTTLKDISYCPRIKEIYLRKNKILSLNELRYLKNLPNLQVLWLSDNPCTEEENYKDTVLRNLPKLKKLDSGAVTEVDLEAAIKDGKLVSDDKDLPVYDGLNLDNTLTSQILKSHLQNMAGDEKEEINAPDELPNQLHKPSIEASNLEKSKETSDPLDVTEDIETKQETLTTMNGMSKTKTSNTITAVLLLLEDLSEEELHEIKNQTEILIASKCAPVKSLLVD